MSKKTYQLPYTDNAKRAINVPRRIFINDLVDLTLIGKRTLEYGKQLNENMLHLLEHFSCPADPNNLEIPDPANKLSDVLNNPVEGQLWYNSSSKKIHVWDNTRWTELHELNSVNANSGFIYDGEYIPIPENKFGALHKLDDCAISVTPVYMGYPIQSFECYSNPFGKVFAQYTDMDGTVHSGYAHYAIICDGACRLPPPPVYLISVPDSIEVERYTSVTLSVVIAGNPSEHNFKWVRTAGPSINLEYVDDYTVTFIADADSAGDIELTFYIDRNTSIEQKLTTVVTQLGELQFLTSKNYGINKIVDSISPVGISVLGGILKEPPPPYDMGGEDVVQPEVALRGGLLWDTFLSTNTTDSIQPNVSLLGGDIKLALLSITADAERIQPSVSLLGGDIKMVLFNTSFNESIQPTVTLTGGELL